VADRTRSLLRRSDTAGRYGGEEFTLILLETDMDGAMTVAERLRRAIAAEAVAVDRWRIPVTVSIGVSSLEDDTRNHEDLLKQADSGLYAAKEGGRDRVVAG